MKDSLIEIKNNLQGNISRVDEAENQINDLEPKEVKKKKKNTQNPSEQQDKTRIKKNEDSISRLQDICKHSNIHVIGVPEREEKKQETGHLFEKMMKENFLNLMKGIDIQLQERQRVPNKMDEKRPAPRRVIIKMPRVKDKES